MFDLGRGFSAVRYRNFRLYWIGQIVSLVGTWMQTVSQPWLAGDDSAPWFEDERKVHDRAVARAGAARRGAG